MDLQIRYATTADGVSIPFWSAGSGPPMVATPALPFSHLLEQWRFAEWRAFDERFIRNRRFVRFEHRGCGLADRVVDFSLDGLVRDLEAVVDELELERFDLMGIVHAGAVAIAYAVRHPERVRTLLLWCAYASNREYGQSPQVAGSRGLITTDWELYSETTGHRLIGWEHGGAAHWFAALMRASITGEAMAEFYREFAEVDVTPLLPSVCAPTLVAERAGIPWFPVEIGQRLAREIPGGRLAVIDGTSIAYFVDHPEEVYAALEGFLAEADARDGLSAGADGRRRRGPSAATVALTPRELEILRLLAEGYTNKEISIALGLSVRTVERHMTNLMGKLNVRTRTEAASYALRKGLAPR